jgi:hypothetical protein
MFKVVRSARSKVPVFKVPTPYTLNIEQAKPLNLDR